jgi:hypothetical protein
MRNPTPLWPTFPAAAAVALVLVFATACKPKFTPSGTAKPSATKTNVLASATNKPSMEYISVFLDLLPPKGRDPFFPNSTRRNPVPVAVATTDKPPPASELLLKGLVGSANHRLAVINNAILELGESISVRVPSGRVRIKCMEIGEDYAVILVEGEIQPRRLALSKKGH